MEKSGQWSEQKLKKTLWESLRKRNELSNRINVLLAEKEKKLKGIQRRIVVANQQQQLRLERTLRKEEIKQSRQVSQQNVSINSSLFREARLDLENSIHFKQSQLQQTRRQWYSQMKQVHQSNHQRICTGKQQQLHTNQKRRKQVRLMELNSKENIRKYWDKRVDSIHQERQKEQNQNTKFLEDSLNSISILEQKERKLLDEIKNTAIYSQKLKTQPYEVQWIDEKPQVTWRNGQE